MIASEKNEVRVSVCPDGPLLLRGADSVLADEKRYDVERPVIALCRCGYSALLPFCDSTHKQLQQRDGR